MATPAVIPHGPATPRCQPDKSHSDRDALILEHLPWAHSIASHVARMLPTWFVADDLMGPAEIALCQAAAKYDATRGIDFRTYAYKRIYGACFSSARRNEYRERAHHTLTDSHVDGGLSPERQSELSAMAGVWEYVCQLPRPHGRVVRSIYEHGLTGAEAAVQLGVSEAWVCRLHREGLEMLRTMFPQQKSG